jgi:quercetin dioxygenase-like cupin family protein
MNDYTVIPAAAIDQGTDRKEWGSLSWFASRALSGTARLTVGRVVIKRGQNNPRHAHPNCEEVLYLLAGELEHTVGGGSVRLRPGDALVVKPNVFHNARSVGEQDAEMLVIFSSGDREFVAEAAG